MRTFVKNLLLQYNNGLYTLTNHKSDNPKVQILKNMYKSAIDGDYDNTIGNAQNLFESFNSDSSKFFRFIIDNKDKCVKNVLSF